MGWCPYSNGGWWRQLEQWQGGRIKPQGWAEPVFNQPALLPFLSLTRPPVLQSKGAAKTPLRIFLPHNVSLTQGKTGRTEHHKHKCLKSSSFLLNRFCAPSPIQHPVPHLNRRRFTLPPRSPTLIPHPRANLPPCNQRQNLRLTALPIPNSTIAPHFTLPCICTLLHTSAHCYIKTCTPLQAQIK